MCSKCLKQTLFACLWRDLLSKWMQLCTNVHLSWSCKWNFICKLLITKNSHLSFSCLSISFLSCVFFLLLPGYSLIHLWMLFMNKIKWKVHRNSFHMIIRIESKSNDDAVKNRWAHEQMRKKKKSISNWPMIDNFSLNETIDCNFVCLIHMRPMTLSINIHKILLLFILSPPYDSFRLVPFSF